MEQEDKIGVQDSEVIVSAWLSELRKQLKTKSKNELIGLAIHLTVELYKLKDNNEKTSNNINNSDSSVNSTIQG